MFGLSVLNIKRLSRVNYLPHFSLATFSVRAPVLAHMLAQYSGLRL